MVILPRSSQDKVTSIHWHHVTINLILILLADRELNKASFAHLDLFLLIEPCKSMGMGMFLSFEF